MKYNTRLIFVLLVITVFIIIYGCKPQPETSGKEPVITVHQEAVIFAPVVLPIYTSGRLHPTEEIKLSFKTGGIVERIYVSEGQTVRKGDILARLKMEEIDAVVNQARDGYIKARRDFERISRLYSDSVTTLEQKQDAETVLNIAESRLKIARFNREHSVISAPADGKILKKFFEEDELTSSGYPVLLFGSGNNNWITRVGVTEKDIIRLQPGDSAEIRVDAYPDNIFPASVSEIGEAAHPLNGTFEVELTLALSEYKLISGLIARVVIFPSGSKPAYSIPIEAVVEADAGEGFVFVVDEFNRKARKVSVKLGPIFRDRIIVTDGVENIPAVITEGASYLTEGSLLQVQH